MEAVTYTLERGHYVIIPFLACVAAILLLGALAPKLGLTDKPSARKNHQGEVPLVGGLSIFFSIVLSIAVLSPDAEFLPVLILCSVLLVVGVLDDLHDIPSTYRLVLQGALAGLMIYFGGYQINYLGNVLGFGEVYMPASIGFVFTVLCTIGVINSINMIDGADGLAGFILMISFGALSFLAWYNGEFPDVIILVIIFCALLAFLFFNARVFVERAAIFMGDSGSMFLGFMLCWYFLKLSQTENPALSPVAAGWLFGVPLADTVVVLIRRIRNGVSPFTAARDHVHHRLLDSGRSVRRTVFLLAGIHLVLVTIGIFISLNPAVETLGFWSFVVLTGLHYFVTSRFFITLPKSRRYQ